jgi:hypothetical protein
MKGSTRDSTLMTDPNSIFAVSRALRKSIVETDPNAKNRNEAIRDEKHLAYKSVGKDSYESFKYDILTSLEQLDTYFLELETVLGKITSDQDALVLQQQVRKQQTPAKRRGRPPKAKVTGAGYSGGKRCCFNSTYCNGTAHYRNPKLRGGVVPDLPKDKSIMDVLKGAMKSSSSSKTLQGLLAIFFPQVEYLIERYNTGEVTNEDVLDSLSVIYDKLDQDEIDKLDAIDGEKDGMIDIYNALVDWIDTLPTNAPEALAEPIPVASLKKRRSIPILSGNEFIVSTLSKINILLIKLIAEYNGKILVNYKKFLQSDLEEIALKVIDSQRRFQELKTYLNDYEEGTKAVNISKFLSTIENNFQKFVALSSRSIANFVNPNIQFLPSFSQQLSGTFQDPKQPFNLSEETQTENKKKAVRKADERIIKANEAFTIKVDKLAKEYNSLSDAFQQERDNVFNAAKEKIEEVTSKLSKLEEKMTRRALSPNENANYLVYQRKLASAQKKLETSARRMDDIRRKIDTIEAMPEFEFF